MNAVSSWSLHRTLGSFVGPDTLRSTRIPTGGPAGLDLLDLPAELAGRGFDTLQLCHFHLPSTDAGYLDDLRGALADASVRLDALLIDDGDLTSNGDQAEQEAWVSDWIGVAEQLGADRARVIAGRTAPTPETIRTAAAALRRLAERHSVRIVTENWHELLVDAASVTALFARTGDEVGLLIDLGNWTGTDKYDELAAVAVYAETCHAKCHGDPPELDEADYQRSLQVLRDADYSGPLALVYDGADADEWRWLGRERSIVDRVFG